MGSIFCFNEVLTQSQIRSIYAASVEYAGLFHGACRSHVPYAIEKSPEIAFSFQPHCHMSFVEICELLRTLDLDLNIDRLNSSTILVIYIQIYIKMECQL